jgi:linoleoyl-CoA desaturase
VGKILFGLAAFAATYAGLFACGLSALAFVGMYAAHGLAQLFLLLNITHDSNHNAISRSPWINRSLSYVMDLCGINSRMWRILHHSGHHCCVNVHGEDEAIFGRGLIRFSPRAPFKKFHRYQYLYAFPLYCCFSLDYIFLKDIEYSLGPSGEILKRGRLTWREAVLLFGGKLSYVLYMVALPAAFSGQPVWLVLLSFVLAHLAIGFLSVLVFQTSHVVENNSFPKSRTEHGNAVRQVLCTTADYATESRLVTWLVGGLNHHVIHHLSPHVCHTHYRALTKIVKETAREYGEPYREHRTVQEAVVQHARLLNRLSQI